MTMKINIKDKCNECGGKKHKLIELNGYRFPYWYCIKCGELTEVYVDTS
jgi:predicted nucleic-acid-binding Zn-ribbon protein